MAKSRAEVRLVLEELDALDVAVRNRSGTASGRLRLTAPVSFGNTQLTPALVQQGAQDRFVPIVMTALVAALGLLPLALGLGRAGDAAAAERFRQIQAAYDVLRAAEERRLAL